MFCLKLQMFMRSRLAELLVKTKKKKTSINSKLNLKTEEILKGLILLNNTLKQFEIFC